MDKYVCIDPPCKLYLKEVERKKDCSNPVCKECGKELQKES